MNLQSMPASGGSPEVPVNSDFEALDWASVYAKNAITTTALIWGYLGGRWGGLAISAGTVTLTNASTNYVVIHRGTGAVSTSTSSTNWDNTLQYARLYKLTTAGSVVTVTEDHRAGPYGALGGLAPGVPQISKSAAYTTVLADANGHVYHPSSDNNPRTFTIDSNANVPYQIGTTITFVNEINTVTIAITSDTLTLAGSGSTGSRTLAANGIATALKVAPTKWVINGAGIT